MFRAKRSTRPTVKIFYATETGTAKRYAKKLEGLLGNMFNVKIIEMNKFDPVGPAPNDVSGYCLFVSSTFGNGDPPRMAEMVAEWIDNKLTKNDVINSKSIELPETIEEEEPGVVLRSTVKTSTNKRLSVKRKTLYQRMAMKTQLVDMHSLR